MERQQKLLIQCGNQRPAANVGQIWLGAGVPLIIPLPLVGISLADNQKWLKARLWVTRPPLGRNVHQPILTLVFDGFFVPNLIDQLAVLMHSLVRGRSRNIITFGLWWFRQRPA
jgi:hypothetical protein